jgi:hypothetical protein
MGRITVPGQSGQKARDPISTNKLGVVVLVYNRSYMRGINRRILVQDGPSINERKTLSEK